MTVTKKVEVEDRIVVCDYFKRWGYLPYPLKMKIRSVYTIIDFIELKGHDLAIFVTDNSFIAVPQVERLKQMEAQLVCPKMSLTLANLLVFHADFGIPLSGLTNNSDLEYETIDFRE